jgi:hypothetical protein
MSERPLPLKGSGRTKADQRGHVIELFFHIPRARTLVISMGQLVFWFLTKGHTSAEIRYFSSFGYWEIYVTPSVRGLRVALATLPNTPLTVVGVGSIVNESLSLTPAKGEPGQVRNLCVRSLTCTSSGDDVSRSGCWDL